jgi:hypothetical protein
VPRVRQGTHRAGRHVRRGRSARDVRPAIRNAFPTYHFRGAQDVSEPIAYYIDQLQKLVRSNLVGQALSKIQHAGPDEVYEVAWDEFQALLGKAAGVDRGRRPPPLTCAYSVARYAQTACCHSTWVGPVSLSVSNVVKSWTVRPASSVIIPLLSGWLYRNSPVLTRGVRKLGRGCRSRLPHGR